MPAEADPLPAMGVLVQYLVKSLFTENCFVTMDQKTVSYHHILRVTEKLRSLRRKQEYSQEYMAFMLNISQNAYSRLENGKTPLTINRLFEICALLKVDPGQLLQADADALG